MSIDSGLVDSRLGLVTDLDRVPAHPTLPAALSMAAARLAGLHAGAATPGGAAWWSPEQAAAAALGEAVERACAARPTVVAHAGWEQLDTDGTEALDPRDLALHSPEQRADPAFPFAAPSVTTPIAWCAASPWHEPARQVLAPASHVALDRVAHEPSTHVPVNAGIAAGPDLPSAALAALEEVVERHAVATAWLAGLRWPQLLTPPWLGDALGGRAATYDVAVHDVPNPFGLPVTAVLLTERDGPVIGMGTALRPTRAVAIAKASAEAVVSAHAAHQLDDAATVAAWEGTTLPPWRPDRSYRAAYRPDWRDVVDVFCHVQLYLDPTMRAPLLARLATGIDVGWPVGGDVGDRTAYPDLVIAGGLMPYVSDLTTPDVARCGYVAARCLVPGLRSTAPAAFPHLGGEWPAPPTALLPLPHA